jgi:hypothetical protein
LYTFENDASDYSGRKTGRLDRFTMSGDTASRGSRQPILGRVNGAGCSDPRVDCLPAEYASHTVGTIKFAADGRLFVSSGDAASFNNVDDRPLRAQDLDSLAGKILRVTVGGNGVASNPFWTGEADANRSKVWAYGLRNPFRFNLRPGTNVPYYGDVGWNEREEVGTAPGGANLGWPCYEGVEVQPGYESKAVCQTLYACGSGGVRMPLVDWGHGAYNGWTSSSATGGAFYTGTAFPAEYRGAYFYSDYGKQFIRYLRVNANNDLGPDSDTQFAPPNSSGNVVTLEMGPDQDLYYLQINSNQLRRIRYVSATNTPPSAAAATTPSGGLAPLAVQFSSAGSVDPEGDPLAYDWSVGDGGSSTQANPSHTYTADGAYTATLTVREAAAARTPRA